MTVSAGDIDTIHDFLIGSDKETIKIADAANAVVGEPLIEGINNDRDVQLTFSLADGGEYTVILKNVQWDDISDKVELPAGAATLNNPELGNLIADLVDAQTVLEAADLADRADLELSLIHI